MKNRHATSQLAIDSKRSRLRAVGVRRILWDHVCSRSMHRDLSVRVAAVVGVTFFAGCFSPNHARLPMMQPAHPQSEAQAFQQQDPFPDPDIGPDIMSRPPDYIRPRTESRRAAEQRLFQGTPSGPEFSPPGYPRGGLNRPNAVN